MRMATRGRVRPRSEAAIAARELERYLDSGTYGHAAALAIASAAVPVELPTASAAPELGEALLVVSDPGNRALGVEAPSSPPAGQRQNATPHAPEPLSEACLRLIDCLSEAADCVADLIRTASDPANSSVTEAMPAGRRQLLPRSRRGAEGHSLCDHPEGHELKLVAEEGLCVETYRECPCCNARLWITLPSVAEIIDSATDSGCNVPDLDVELTRRERQVLNVLYRSRRALRHRQLAGLVWSDPDRTHDVRTVLYRLRRKLRNSGWDIPVPTGGKGICLVADDQHRLRA